MIERIPGGRRTVNTGLALLALFTTVLAVLVVQVARGNDPALGRGQGATSASAVGRGSGAGPAQDPATDPGGGGATPDQGWGDEGRYDDDGERGGYDDGWGDQGSAPSQDPYGGQGSQGGTVQPQQQQGPPMQSRTS